MEEAAALLVRGRGAAGREKPKEFLSNSQRTGRTPNLSFLGLGRSHALHNGISDGSSMDQREIGHPTRHITETPTIDELEESLRKLKVQVDSLTSSLSFHPDEEDVLDLASPGDSNPFSSRWPEAPSGTYVESSIGGPPKPPDESEWFLKPKHLLRSLGDYSALTHLGLPTFALSSTDRVAGMLGSEIAARNSVASSDLAFPLKLGAPHVIGVRSLLPPKIPVRSRSPERAVLSCDRGRSLSLSHSESPRSWSFSPASKRSRWLRSRSQSPRPVWRPSSAKANACAQPPPQLGRPRSSKKKNGSSRQSRWRLYRPGSLASRADTPGRASERKAQYDSWSPYSLPSAAISSPTAQEINERFLQTLAEGATGSSLIEMSPYQKELARLRLERLRVEEAWLLELKRQQELERTRGPKPKWYEIKNSQFHYEARKNNELLRNSQDLQSVYKYRQELATASKEFQQLPSSTYLETH
ncbi:uncharacterized protein LOC129344829 [Eublepharis macularius]|uniref:Uncharacterized protein LOC129344829 n=1 Tax=Eublepharis macularius TaxID=481883 RepID=A0AA97KKQ9_EUBMA|nr:uncharacterized protein LOC129344829 [Eublepharis macularius]